MTSRVDKIFLRDLGICYLCGKFITIHRERSRDHIVPRVFGGVESAANLALAHKRCNQMRGDRLHGYDKTLFIFIFSSGEWCIGCSHENYDHNIPIRTWNTVYQWIEIDGITSKDREVSVPVGCNKCGCTGMRVLDMSHFKPEPLLLSSEVPDVSS